MICQQIADCSVIAGRWPIDPSKPTLFFIHGAALSKGLWKFQIQALLDVANTIALDLAGHGQSKGEGCDSIYDYCRCVMDVVESVHSDQPVLCGLSMGGAISQALLVAHPDQFRAGILMHTGAKLKVMPLIFDTIKQDYRQYYEMMMQFALAQETDKAWLATVFDDIVTWSADVALKDFYACDSFNIMDQLDKIQAPVLVIAGDQDNITPPKYSEFLSNQIPNARLIMIKGAGHISPLEKPEAVNQAIRDFLNHLKPNKRSPEKPGI